MPKTYHYLLLPLCVVSIKAAQPKRQVEARFAETGLSFIKSRHPFKRLVIS